MRDMITRFDRTNVLSVSWSSWLPALNNSVTAEPTRLQDGLSRLLPPRSMVGQLPLEQAIGVRIPGGQPILASSAILSAPSRTAPKSVKHTHNDACFFYLGYYGGAGWSFAVRFLARSRCGLSAGIAPRSAGTKNRPPEAQRMRLTIIFKPRDILAEANEENFSRVDAKE